MKLKDLDYCPDPRWPWSKRYLSKVEAGPMTFINGEAKVDLRIVGPVTTRRLGIRRWIKTRRGIR